MYKCVYIIISANAKLRASAVPVNCVQQADFSYHRRPMKEKGCIVLTVTDLPAMLLQKVQNLPLASGHHKIWNNTFRDLRHSKSFETVCFLELFLVYTFFSQEQKK